MIIAYKPVPYGGGISKDGQKVYIDPRLKKTLKVDGISVHVPTITAHHERREWEHMQDGLPYRQAHRKALKYENNKLRELGLGDKQIAAYQRHVIGLCQKAYKSGEGAPDDLFTGPYKDERETMLLEPGHPGKKKLTVD